MDKKIVGLNEDDMTEMCRELGRRAREYRRKIIYGVTKDKKLRKELMKCNRIMVV